MESNITTTIDQHMNPKYQFAKALRPFSFSVALITCGLGISVGQQLQNIDSFNAFLVLLAGLLLQAGVNLINDHADLKNKLTRQLLSDEDISRIVFNYKSGWLCFAVCILIGLYLTYQTNLFLFLLAVLGGFGALFYTTEPIHYKRRGLGVFLVFFFMGVLMVYGSYFAVTGLHALEPIIISIPISFFTSALLLSNELRDYSTDKQEGLKTLTVRLGRATGKNLYTALLMLGFAFALIIAGGKHSWEFSFIFMPALALSITAIITVYTQNNLISLPPKTGKIYLIFGICQILLMQL